MPKMPPSSKNTLGFNFARLPVLLIGAISLLSGRVQGDDPQNLTLTELPPQAYLYTHLEWPESLLPPVKLEILPIKNYSGVPIETEQESKAIFQFGLIPRLVDSLLEDAVLATRRLQPVETNSDYRLALSIDQYQPDHHWQFETPSNQSHPNLKQSAHRVKLSLNLTGNKKAIKPWSETIDMPMANCDLNRFPQPLTEKHNRNSALKDYLHSYEGQNFLAAVNYLLVKVMDRLSQKPLLAEVEKKVGDEIYLKSHAASFTVGECLDVFANNPGKGKELLSLGQVKVVSSFHDRAIAYPLNLRGDHITEGDWVELSQNHFIPPRAIVNTGHCQTLTYALD